MPRDRLSADVTSGPRAPKLSIRARIMLLALLAIVPLMLDRVRLLESSRTERIDMAYAEAVDITKRAADAQLEVINSTRAVLQVIARSYVTLALTGQDCANFLDGFATDIPWIKGYSVVGPNGRIICSTRPNAVGLNVSDREYVQAARRSWDFVLSDYIIERASQSPAIIAAYPTLGKDASVDAIILAPVDLQWVGRLSGVVKSKPGVSVVLVDGAGTILSSIPDPKKFAGRRLADHSLVRQVLARTDGTITAESLDGVRRITAFMQLPGTDARIMIGLDEREVLSRIDREIGIAYLQLALFGMLILLVSWFGGERLIVEPIRALARTATRIGRGDLAARPDYHQWAPEFAPLATAFSDMAAKLSEREQELNLVNRHLKELASIDSLSGLANRRGFDARFDLEWQRACERREPISLLMIDVDQFKLFNDSYGHLEGDRCLQLIGEVMLSLGTGPADCAARYGGEEFALLIPGTPLPRATEIAEALRAAIEALNIANQAAAAGRITISIGVACIVPGAGDTPAMLFEAADAGLYLAKRRGRNTVAIDAPALLTQAG